ncbi:MAG: hypothetical protein ACKOBG_02025 [Actinomycetota bacterium]
MSPAGRGRHPGPRTLALTLVGIVALTVTGCGRKSAEPAAPEVERIRPELEIGRVQLASVEPGLTLPPAARKAALRSARAYVAAALTAPLETGRTAPAYAGLFAPSLRAAATGPDAATLTDAGLAAPGAYRSQAGPVELAAFAGPDGRIAFVAPRFTVTTDITTADGPVRLQRNVELTLTARGPAWPITGYRVVVSRARPPAPTTTSTAVAGATP